MLKSTAIWYLLWEDREEEDNGGGGWKRKSVSGVDPCWRCQSGPGVEDRPSLHGDGDQQHVKALEEHVAGVAKPDVGGEGHEEEGAGAQGREDPQRQLPPPLPPHLREAHSVGRGCTLSRSNTDCSA